MGNKRGRKPSASIKLLRKRRGRCGQQAKLAKQQRASTVQPSTIHIENDNPVCTSNQAANITASIEPEPSTSGHLDNDFDAVYDDNISTGSEHDKSNETKYGRRIVNVLQFFTQLQEISSHGPLNCGLQAVEIMSETRSGLISLYALKCNMCNMTFQVHNDNPTDVMDLNTSAVAGTVAIGCGFTQLTDLSAAVGLVPMSKNIFTSKLALVHKKWEEELLKSMGEAADEERTLAIDEGRISPEGIAIIDVIADGCYSKRSYKKNYSALSGAAAIIGKRTNKILYLAIKNKYCSICSVAQSKCLDAKDHTCYKNYAGSSTGMESDILVEGFKRSIDMHNLIYGRLISDGDANTYSKILQTRPYESYTVEKVECRNHLLRNMCNKLTAISTDTKYTLKYRKYVTKKRILSIRKVIVEAIKQYKANNNVTALYQDILIAPEHAFGQHNKCKEYFCTKNEEDNNLEKEMFSNSIWQRIKLITTQIAAHSRSLIVDVDSNSVERYHSIVAKFVGGKRINFSQRYQYSMRCNVAALSFNTHKPLSALHKSIVGKSPRNQIAKNEKKNQKSRLLTQKYLRKKKRLFNSQDSRNYGEDCSRPDIDEEMMMKSKQEFVQNLNKTSQERERISRETVLQSGSSEWMELRRNLLTASTFGKVVKRRRNTSCHNLVKDILYKKSIDHVFSIKHGKDSEKGALEQLSEQENIKIDRCGLFIDPDVPYLGATPDGLVEDKNMIVEIKCPTTSFNIGFDKAIENKKLPIIKRSRDGSLSINKGHDWYLQVQGQLHVTRKERCLFGIWSGKEFPVKTFIIERDDGLWKEKMESKLHKFYLDCLLPEIIDPRFTRKMAIRDPDYIIEAMKEQKNKEKAMAEKRKKKKAMKPKQKKKEAPKKRKPDQEILDESPPCRRPRRK